MKKLLILVLLLSIGCAQQYVCPDGVVVYDPEACPEHEVPEEIEEPEVSEPELNDTEINEPEVNNTEAESEPGLSLEKKVHDMITNAYNRVESYSFLYVGPPDKLPQDIYSVRGDDVKILVMKATDHYISQPYTHITMDLEEESAHAWCEATEAGRCEDGFADVGPANYDEWKVPLPMEWLDRMEGAEYVQTGPKFEDRGTEEIRFETIDGLTGRMHLVKYYFIPARVILDNGTEYEYRDLSINTVSEKDITPNI